MAHSDGEVGGGEFPETEPTYEDEDYEYIDYRDPRFDDVYGMWHGAHLMIADK